MSRIQLLVIAVVVFWISSVAMAGHHRKGCGCAVSGGYGYAGASGQIHDIPMGYGSPGMHGAANTAGFEAAFGGFGQIPGAYGHPYGSPAFYPYSGEGTSAGDPYTNHFGTGFHRSSIAGHYRFPYYTYRAPWYYPGTPIYHRDTNFAW